MDLLNTMIDNISLIPDTKISESEYVVVSVTTMNTDKSLEVAVLILLL